MGSPGFRSNSGGALPTAAGIPAHFRTWAYCFGRVAAGTLGQPRPERFAQRVVQTRWRETYARRSHHELQQFLRVGPGKGSTKGSGQSRLENATVGGRNRRIMRKHAEARHRRIDSTHWPNRAAYLPASLRGGLVHGDSVGRFSAGETGRSCAAKTGSEIHSIYLLF